MLLKVTSVCTILEHQATLTKIRHFILNKVERKNYSKDLATKQSWRLIQEIPQEIRNQRFQTSIRQKVSLITG